MEKPREVLAQDLEGVTDLSSHRQTWGLLLLISMPLMLWHEPHFDPHMLEVSIIGSLCSS